MPEYFPEVKKTIKYEGPKSKNALAFKHYNPKQKILGKTMEDHFRFAVCYWHTFKCTGADPFGSATMVRGYNASSDPVEVAEATMDAAFEFITKLGVKFWTFHDRDIAPEGKNLTETNKILDGIVKIAKRKQSETGVKLLWGTANLFSNPRYMAGASTNPNPAVFAHAAAQVKKALEVTKYLGGQGYTFWGGREGYDTLLNTDMQREADQLGAFLNMAVEYKKKIGFKGQFYIEPKPKEPTKHQYDFDAQSCHAFLQKYGLVDHFKMNIEANHATLAGHSFHHDLSYSIANGILGSVDANRGDTLLGWDTDQFPTDIMECALAMWYILKMGGFKTGGLNFDAKVRRQSYEGVDLFHAHIGAMDAFARGLKIAAKLTKDKFFEKIIQKRYGGWSRGVGKEITSGKMNFEKLEAYTLKNGEPKTQSGQQELIENMLNEYME
ncbi:MAG: xylose isomerase [Candidatus Hinthialibacter antarcticus]|nr:xylose isomerase [Candidatus Hinthialibacter antarcticus]